MNDYKELVAELRKWQTLGDAPVGNGFGVIVGKLTLKQAADAIEQLVKERDAAVADIEKRCWNCGRSFLNRKNKSPCKYAKICANDKRDDYWQWRGVKENNT